MPILASIELVLYKESCRTSMPREAAHEMHAVQIYADPDGPGLAGSLIKAVYREYTDARSSQRVPAAVQHGILGPILHARIGDTITIVFKVASTLLSILL